MKSDWALDRLLQHMTRIILQRDGRTITMEEMSVELARPRPHFEAELLLLAELGRAHFSPDGHTLQFPEGFERHVAAGAPLAPRVWRRVQRYLLVGARLFLGGGLLLSLVLVGVTLLVLLFVVLSASRGGRRERPALPLPVGWGPGPGPGGGGGAPGSHLFSYLLLRDLLLYSTWRDPFRPRARPGSPSFPDEEDDEPGPGLGPPSPPRGAPHDEPGDGEGNGREGWSQARDPREEGPGADSPRGLLRDIFRFLFGDGFRAQDDHHRRSMTAVGHMIRRQAHGPTVTAAQMAPYLDEFLFDPALSGAPSPLSSRYTQHEGYVLPVLRCFQGQAEASEDGERLVYHFPLLGTREASVSHAVQAYETSAATRRMRPDLQPVLPESEPRPEQWEAGAEDPPILEWPHVFFYTRQTLALGVWNILQVALLGWCLFYGDVGLWVREAHLDPAVAQMVWALLALCRGLYGYLLAYACFYLLVPAARYAYVRFLNRGVARRNEHRMRVVAALRSADPLTSPTMAGSYDL